MDRITVNLLHPTAGGQSQTWQVPAESAPGIWAFIQANTAGVESAVWFTGDWQVVEALTEGALFNKRAELAAQA